jgi:hypothetical protein
VIGVWIEDNPAAEILPKQLLSSIGLISSWIAYQFAVIVGMLALFGLQTSC